MIFSLFCSISVDVGLVAFVLLTFTIGNTAAQYQQRPHLQQQQQQQSSLSCLNNPCKNNARCVNGPNNSGYTCMCMPPWSGLNCDQSQQQLQQQQQSLNNLNSKTNVGPENLQSGFNFNSGSPPPKQQQQQQDHIFKQNWIFTKPIGVQGWFPTTSSISTPKNPNNQFYNPGPDNYGGPWGNNNYNQMAGNNNQGPPNYNPNAQAGNQVFNPSLNPSGWPGAALNSNNNQYVNNGAGFYGGVNPGSGSGSYYGGGYGPSGGVGAYGQYQNNPAACQPPCLNGGKCIFAYGSNGYRCKCEDNYSGGLCETYQLPSSTIVGIVLGTVIPFVAILITVAIFVYLCCIRKNKTNKKKQQQSPLPITNNNYNNNSVNGKPMSNVLYTRASTQQE